MNEYNYESIESELLKLDLSEAEFRRLFKPLSLKDKKRFFTKAYAVHENCNQANIAFPAMLAIIMSEEWKNEDLS